ncbi:ABC transporter ATP-binding protein [Paenibacillus athensensis]|uniref:ABC transporter n=1 Tax=Paenibacillus athensensis TaxID=1967502 RepID=A0A4Y8QB31_9BACL|nr:ABC transporter ATP-binding protein [Paenibacillus athensensis]MCD1257671.1 ABC transporter ATP-binding protein [Paenibacillus athensensis]
METIVETKQLGKSYPNRRGIRDVSLQLFAGDVYGLLGPNGAGKTTFLKLITGLLRPDRGTVQLFGVDIADDFARAIRNVGCMIESADFYDFLTARHYLQMVARFYPDVTDKAIDEMLEQVGLNKVRSEKIRGFSTGMKQKLALAAAMLPKPRLVILDEPTNGMDIEGTVMFRKLVQEFASRNETSFLISSHMIHELEQLCNRIGILAQGKLQCEGNVSALLQSGQSLESFYIDQLEWMKKEAEHVES